MFAGFVKQQQQKEAWVFLNSRIILKIDTLLLNSPTLFFACQLPATILSGAGFSEVIHLCCLLLRCWGCNTGTCVVLLLDSINSPRLCLQSEENCHVDLIWGGCRIAAGLEAA